MTFRELHTIRTRTVAAFICSTCKTNGVSLHKPEAAMKGDLYVRATDLTSPLSVLYSSKSGSWMEQVHQSEAASEMRRGDAHAAWRQREQGSV